MLQYLKSKIVPGDGDQTEKTVKPTAKKEKVHKEYMHLKVRGFACQVKKKDIRDFFAPLKPDSIRLPPKVKGVAYIGFSSEKEMLKALNKHRSFHGKCFVFSSFFFFRSTSHLLSLQLATE